MKSYKEIVAHIIKNGEKKENRTGVDTIAVAGVMFEHDMSTGFPLLTTKYVPFRLVSSELEFFIKGMTDKQWLIDQNNHIWDEFSYVDGKSLTRTKEEREIYQKKSNDLGVLYGYQWRFFNAQTRTPPPEANIPYKSIINCNAPKYSSLNYGDFYLLEDLGEDVKIQFKETGFIKIVSKNQFNSMSIKDPYFKKYYGVACIGCPDTKHPYLNKVKSIWTNMISRCYNKSADDYPQYGGVGVTVSNDWLVFEYFLNDFLSILNSDKKIQNWDEYSLDKDIVGDGYHYSLQTCMWAHIEDQSLWKKTNFLFDATSPTGETFKNCVNLTKFCRLNKIDPGDGNKRLNGKLNSKPSGWDFTNKRPILPPRPQGYDQLAKVVETLKTNPDDRRIIVSAWNPLDLDKMALPPCHYGFQVTVINGKLNLLWNQRSVDVALGLPFNIASYGLLLMLLCKETGLQPGRLIGFLADTHIYKNHIQGLLDQLNRSIYTLPRVTFKKFTSIFDWSYQDTELFAYEHHPAIAFDIAV